MTVRGSATRRTHPCPHLSSRCCPRQGRPPCSGRCAQARRPRAPLRVLLPPSGRWPNPPRLRSPGRRRSACRSSTAPSSTTRPPNLSRNLCRSLRLPSRWSPRRRNLRPPRSTTPRRSISRSICPCRRSGVPWRRHRSRWRRRACPGRCNAAWTRHWRRPPHPSRRRLRSSRVADLWVSARPSLLRRQRRCRNPQPMPTATGHPNQRNVLAPPASPRSRSSAPSRPLRPPRCRRPRPRCRRVRT